MAVLIEEALTDIATCDELDEVSQLVRTKPQQVQQISDGPQYPDACIPEFHEYDVLSPKCFEDIPHVFPL